MNQTISLPRNYVDKLGKEKTVTGQSKSEIIRRALDLYFKEKERDNA